MRRAVILGGTGAIGWATGSRLATSGWDVVVTGRDDDRVPSGFKELGVRFVRADRLDGAALAAAVGPGADLLVDCACFTASDARELLARLNDVSCAVMVSSKAVYVDDEGRHANSQDRPRFEGPIAEEHPTLRPSSADDNSGQGYGPNKVAAEEVLLESGHAVTVLRPSKVHGAWARRPREWVFVKRIIDKRDTVLLARRGAGADHPSAALNIAALVETVADKPGRRVLNIADPDCPNVYTIASVIATELGHDWKVVPLDPGESTELGTYPWDSVPPVVLDCTAARHLGYRPVGDYRMTVSDELDWLVACAGDDRSRHLLPRDDDPYFAPMIDYRKEDDYLGRHGT
jgi:nucleoside-diphosphate-sugar epimerase